MEAALLEILDKAVSEGGENVTKTKLVGKSKEGLTQLEELCEKNYLVSDGKRSPKFTLTQSGREQWAEHTPPERVEEVQEQERRQQEQELLALLNLIETKTTSGKAFTAAETRKLQQRLDESLELKYVAKGEKKNTYELLPSGMLFRFQVQLRDLHRPWEEFQRQHSGSNDPNGEQDPLDAFRSELWDKVESARKAYDEAIESVSAFSGLANAVQKLKEATVGEVKEQIAGAESVLQQLLEIEEKRLEIAHRIEELSTQLLEPPMQEPVHEPVQEPPQTFSTPETEFLEKSEQWNAEDVWELTKQRHDEVTRTGALVKIPEMTDYVLEKVAGVSKKEFHDLLLKWHNEERLILQICNDPPEEPRSSEGFDAGWGLLLYIEIV